MYNAVGLFYTDNQTTIDLVTARTNAFAQFNLNRVALNTAIAGQSLSTTGSTKDKKLLRAALNEITLSILQPCAAWATVVENNTLRDQFNVSLSVLQDVKDETFPSFCRTRHQLVDDNLIALADYDITAPIIASWLTAIDNFDVAIGRPRIAVTTRSTKTQTIKTLISKTGKLLKEVIDPLMVAFRIPQPELYDGYTKARIVIDRRGPGSGSGGGTTPTGMKFNGTVTDSFGNPLGGVVIRLSNAEGSIETTTGSEGFYTLPITLTETTTATLSAESPGKMPSSRPVTAVPGVNQEQNFQLFDMPMPPTP